MRPSVSALVQIGTLAGTLSLLAGPAIATGQSLAKPSGPRVSLADAGAAIAAHGTASGVPACSSCHGARGEGNDAAGYPRLAGASPTYLKAQLTAFAEGTRHNPVMQPFAKALTQAEQDAVAAYYAKLVAPQAKARPADNAAVEPSQAGAWLALRGRWRDELPACSQCHGADGSGVGEHFPALAGQPARYIAEQLQAWQQGLRPPGPLGLMPHVASKLSSGDIAAVAAYYAGLPGNAPIQPAAVKE